MKIKIRDITTVESENIQYIEYIFKRHEGHSWTHDSVPLNQEQIQRIADLDRQQYWERQELLESIIWRGDFPRYRLTGDPSFDGSALTPVE